MSSYKNDDESAQESLSTGSSDNPIYLSTLFCSQRQPDSCTTPQFPESEQHVEPISNSCSSNLGDLTKSAVARSVTTPAQTSLEPPTSTVTETKLSSKDNDDESVQEPLSPTGSSDTQNYLSTLFCRQRQPYSFTTIESPESEQHVEPIPSSCSSNISDQTQEEVACSATAPAETLLEPSISSVAEAKLSSEENDDESVQEPLLAGSSDMQDYLSTLFCRERQPYSFTTNEFPDSKHHVETIPSSCSSKGNQTQSGAARSVPAPNRTSKKSPASSLPSKSTLSPGKAKFTYVEKRTAPVYKIPKGIEELFKYGTIPEVLSQHLSLSNYKEYFAVLLYAEDFYIEKYKDFQLENVKLVPQKAEIRKKSNGDNRNKKEEKIFVAFEVTAKGKDRPFLLSRDFVFARPLDSSEEPYKGIISPVQKSNMILVEFRDDFHERHHPNRRYDISFSLNRVCLKRAHQAVEAASNITFRNFLFPKWDRRQDAVDEQSCCFFTDKLNQKQKSVILKILSLKGPPPFIIRGSPSKTALVVQEAICQVYKKSNQNRILICALTNRRCDELMSSLNKYILESTMFRANAAFREIEEVPDDILSSSRYREECFVCPPLHELRKCRVISSTYMSSFRLHSEGIIAGHFSHIFLLDASSAIEPEIAIPLVHLANEKTVVVVAGESGVRPHWVRSDIANAHGLKISYFERICRMS